MVTRTGSGEEGPSITVKPWTCSTCYGKTWDLIQTYPKTTLTVLAIAAAIITTPLAMGLLGYAAMPSTSELIFTALVDGAIIFTAYKVLTATKPQAKIKEKEEAPQSPPVEPTPQQKEEAQILAEVAKHVTEIDCWIALRVTVDSTGGQEVVTGIDGTNGVLRAFNVTEFLDEHPGGGEIILENAGTDATEEFIDISHSEDAINMLSDYLVPLE